MTVNRDTTSCVSNLAGVSNDGADSTQHKRAGLTVLDTKMMAALDAHFDAINTLHAESMREYMLIVGDHLLEVSNELDRAKYLFQVSVAMNAMAIAPVVVTLVNFWNPIGFYAGVTALTIMGSSAGIKVGGEKALQDVEDMIHDSPLAITERTCQNAITHTLSTMLPVAQLLRKRFGDEKATAAYVALVSAMKEHSTEKMLDLDKIPEVVKEIIDKAKTSGIPELSLYAQGNSLPGVTSTETMVKLFTRMLDEQDGWEEVNCEDYKDIGKECDLMPNEVASEFGSRLTRVIATVFDVSSRLHHYKEAKDKVLWSQKQIAATTMQIRFTEKGDSWVEVHDWLTPS